MAKKMKGFVVGLDDFNLTLIKHLPECKECEILPAVRFSEIRGVKDFSIPEILKKTEERVKEAGGIDAVVSYLDFPGSVMVPIIAEKYKLPGPSLESVMKCEHKYWSRLEQHKVIPDNIPEFKAFDPFDEKAFDKIGFKPPFWIKPIKSYHSYLAYKIESRKQFEECMEEVREHIDYMVEPFTYIVSEFGMPKKISEKKEKMFAETPIGGHQCTLEGYAFDGEVVIYGLVDSITHKKYPSFARYQYPSNLPYEVQYRMSELSRQVIKQIGLMNSAFNIEFFYNEEKNEINLLEVNPRMSQSHADIFEKVHGISHHHIMLNLALDRRPSPLENEGDFEVAAHFMYRSFKPGKVKEVPSKKEIEKVRKKYPELEIKITVKEGMDLDEIEEHHIDSYSYVLAYINLGGQNEEDLLEKYHDVLESLSFKIEHSKR